MNQQQFVNPEISQFLQDLTSLVDEKLNTSEQEERENFLNFAKQFFNRFPLDELNHRYLSDMFGCVYQNYKFLHDFPENKPKIRLYNPKLEDDGWVCPHTVLLVLQKDMPFLVDSIRIELNRRNISIHAIKSTVLNLQRDKNRHLKNFSTTDNLTEAIVYLEINLLTDKTELAAIEHSLESVLKELECVVRDFNAMCSVAEAAEQNLNFARDSVVVAGVEESQAFLAWMRDNHFTFLGCSEYRIQLEDGEKVLREDVSKRLGFFAYKGGEQNYAKVQEAHAGVARFYLAPQVLTFSKSSVRSRIHRQAYSDYIVVKKFDEQGEVIGEIRFLGLYTSRVYTSPTEKIPLLRYKIRKVFERTGLSAQSHDGKNLQQILDTFPRDELFLANSGELYDTVMGVAQINERHMVKLFMRRDPFGKFVTCLIYVPREVFNTQMRLKFQDIINQEINATACEFTTYFSESILARVYLVFKVNPHLPLEYDQEKLQKRIREVARSWEDHLQEALIESCGEEKGLQLLAEYKDAFSASYKENFESRTAVHDIASMSELKQESDIALSFYQPLGVDEHLVKFKIFRQAQAIELSDIIPVLEHLGLRVLSENPFPIERKHGSLVWLHDFLLSYHAQDSLDVLNVKEQFQSAFSAIWSKQTLSDSFNKLVLAVGVSWREANLFRVYAAYMRQILFPFSEDYIANSLVNHLNVTRQLLDYFLLKFDPALALSIDQRQTKIKEITAAIEAELDKVTNLNEDRILRRYLQLMNISLRTNYFQSYYFQPNDFKQGEQKAQKNYLSIKLSPRLLNDIPEPKPLYEIFVHSPRVEGVHLRTSKVARGGLRWSDRLQDYRTEVLGLVKAQQVKNAVIVPSGAKGGFVCKQLPPATQRDAMQQEAIECYKIFIRGLLDLTDNYVDKNLVSPVHVIKYDDDDPYLVVAADKGTATFSDIANGISIDYQHWLGDAFASGGSKGYDHKAMGITARGAWISVMRHFREKNINIQQENFTVIGIGDMAGDVFGNGMLLSEHICLVAAFNHQHIFIDPHPNAAKSFAERQRLFNTPKSTWADYSKDLMSDGGGIFNRDAKSIVMTQAMKEIFSIEEDQLMPTEFIHRLLMAPVDLIWNGGIGTYVKSSMETHGDVGDKANDNLRVNGNELRCKVFGEGGNLGMTQRGRVEYCLQGGACNTDFIDNAGGVDCSDHEVNVKILLNQIQVNGDLTEKQRNQLLVDMTDNVARLVLKNNYRQTLAISIAETEALNRGAEYRRFISVLESQKRLNRKLEYIPADDVIIERQTHGKGLTRPELAILLSYAKAVLKEDLVNTDLADDNYLVKAIETAFPQRIAQEYSAALLQHPLRREIVATQYANDMVNNMGISFAQRLIESTGVHAADVSKAYVMARDIFNLEKFVQALESLDHQLPSDIQSQLMIGMVRRVRRATRWFLRNRRGNLHAETEINYFSSRVAEVNQYLEEFLIGDALEILKHETNRLREKSVPENLINSVCEVSYLYSGLSIVEAAKLSQQPLRSVAEIYFVLSDYLSLPWCSNQIANLKVETFWQAMARETYMDDLEAQLRSLAIALAKELENNVTCQEIIASWSQQQKILIERWKKMVNELQSSHGTDYAVFSVALRDLLDLAQATQHSM